LTDADSLARTDSQGERLPWLITLGGAIAVLVVARSVEPSATGIGTHEQLGLPPCLFFKLTGLPCPSCGLTTSFAHAARLQFYDALVTQPFGLGVFFLTVLFIPLSCYLIYRRVPAERILYGRWSNPVLYTLVVLYSLGWIYKIIVMRLL
jgi:hypothetical protein